MKKLSICVFFLSGLFVLFMGVLINAAAPAQAAAASGQCVKDAAEDMKECKAVCQDNFLAQKNVCSSVDTTCIADCVASSEQCDQGPMATYNTCKAGCKTTLANAMNSCKSRFAKGSSDMDTCKDMAQVDAFLCRDGCGDSVSADLTDCRTKFRTCTSNCPTSMK